MYWSGGVTVAQTLWLSEYWCTGAVVVQTLWLSTSVLEWWCYCSTDFVAEY